MAGFGGCTAVMDGGEYVRDVKIGWPNRFIIGSYCAWTIGSAIRLAKLTTVLLGHARTGGPRA